MTEVQKAESEPAPRLEELVDAFRALVFFGVAKALVDDDRRQGYEGAVELHVYWPNFFATTGTVQYELTLHCYVFGPSHHCHWVDEDPVSLFQRAMMDVSRWVTELDDDPA